MKRLICIIFIIATIFALTACGNNNNEEVKGDGFSYLSRTERRDFVIDYLKKTYDVNVGITEDIVKDKNGEYYHAKAMTIDGDVINCWISEDKQISDDKFLVDLQDDVKKRLIDALADVLGKTYKMSCSIKLVDRPTKTWTSDELDDLLAADETSVDIILLIPKEGSEDIVAAAKKEFNGKINFINGNLYVHLVDNIDNAETYQFKTDNCDVHRVLTAVG